MIVELIRVAMSEKGTFGVLVLNDIPLCVTIEDPWNNNDRGVSCIPDGVYSCSKHNGAKYKDVWILNNVPGRSAILIHQGNTINDTQGCILVGTSYSTLNGQPGVVSSKVALDYLRQTLSDNFTLVIRDCHATPDFPV